MKSLYGNTLLLNDLAIILSGHVRDLYSKIKEICDFPAVNKAIDYSK